MRLLITGAWGQAGQYREALEHMGHEVRFLQYEKDPLPGEYDWPEGIIGNGIFLSHSIEKFVNLRYIQLTSAGFDRVPMDYVQAHGIEIYNARGVYSAPMAEYAVAGVLQLYKKLDFFRERQRAHVWEKRRDLQELSGQTVCVLGCGSVGTACAKRFAAFDCQVIGVDIFVKDGPYFDNKYPLEDLGEALRLSDIAVITLPLTEQTRGLFSEALFRQMKQGAVLVNIARGGIVDLQALQRNLARLGGAVLDVFPQEPLAEDSPLWEQENVIITPHCSFIGSENGNRLSRLILQNLEGK